MAECDSDALNFSIAIDNKMAKMWEALYPHKNVFVLNNPREISGNISIPKPVVATISNFVSSQRGYTFTQEQIDRFNALPDA